MELSLHKLSKKFNIDTGLKIFEYEDHENGSYYSQFEMDGGMVQKPQNLTLQLLTGSELPAIPR